MSKKATLKSLNKGLIHCGLKDIADLIESNSGPQDLPDLGADNLNNDTAQTSNSCTENRNSSLTNTVNNILGGSKIPPNILNISNNTSCVVHLNKNDSPESENDVLIQKDRVADTAENLTNSNNTHKEKRFKIQCIEDNWRVVLFITSISLLLAVSISLLLSLKIYSVKNDGKPIRIVAAETSCLISTSKYIDECVIVSISHHDQYSQKIENIPADKCVHLKVEDLASKHWPSSFELINESCIFGLSLNGSINQSSLGYFLSKTLSLKNLSLDCKNRKLELHEPYIESLPQKRVTLKHLNIYNCDLHETMKYVRSFANLAELTNLGIKNISLTSENVKELNAIFTQSKTLEHVNVHATHFEAYDTRIILRTRLDSLKSFVIDIESPQIYNEIQPFHLTDFCEMSSKLSTLRITLGYLSLADFYHLSECTELKVVEINILLGPDEIVDLAFDIYYQQFKNIKLNLYFYKCPNYHKLMQLCLGNSHQCVSKSCTITSNCPVSENGREYSLSC